MHTQMLRAVPLLVWLCLVVFIFAVLFRQSGCNLVQWVPQLLKSVIHYIHHFIITSVYICSYTNTHFEGGELVWHISFEGFMDARHHMCRLLPVL